MRSKPDSVDQPERTAHYDCAICIAGMLHNTIAQRQFCQYSPSSRPTSLFVCWSEEKCVRRHIQWRTIIRSAQSHKLYCEVTDQQLRQVRCLFHRLVVSNSRQPGKSDGNSAGCVHIRLAEFGTRYFPDLGLLKHNTHTSDVISFSETSVATLLWYTEQLLSVSEYYCQTDNTRPIDYKL